MSTGVDSNSVITHLTKFSGELVLEKAVMAVQMDEMRKEIEELRAENDEYKKALVLPTHNME